MRTIATLIVIAAAATQAQNARAYEIAAGPGSSLELKVDKTGLLRGKSHRIIFERYEGELSYDAQHPMQSAVRLTIVAASADCRDSWLGAKDQKKVEQYTRQVILESEQHPSIRFESAEVKSIGPDRFDVPGTLTIRGIAKPAIVRVETIRGNDGELSFRGASTIRLTDYGVKPPVAAFGAIGTKDEMELMFQISARPRGGREPD